MCWCWKAKGVKALESSVLKVINYLYLREWKPCYYSREGGQCTECIGHTRFCEARLADWIRGWQWSLAFLAVQIYGCSCGAAAWIQPHCSNHTGRVRVVKTQQLALLITGLVILKSVKSDWEVNKIAGVASFVIPRRPFATLRGAPFLTFAPSNFGVGY